MDAPVFRYASIQRGSIENYVNRALQPVKTIEVGSQLSGQLARVYVDFNDTVTKDQPLALIDPRSFAAKVDEARAAVAVANSFVDIERAKLDRARIDLQNAKGSRDVLVAKLDSVHGAEALVVGGDCLSLVAAGVAQQLAEVERAGLDVVGGEDGSSGRRRFCSTQSHVPGMTCITPRALAEDTTPLLKPLSCHAMAEASEPDTPC